MPPPLDFGAAGEAIDPDEKAPERCSGARFFERHATTAQVRVRMRIMKLSKPSSATCFHASESLRKAEQAVVQLLEHRVGLVVLGIDLLRGLVAGLEHRLRERPQHCALRDQLLERRRIGVIVLADHPGPRIARRDLDRALVGLRQLVPLREIDHVVALAAAFPPARIVVVLRDLDEAELLVVVGADPFGRVDRALLQRRIDVAGGELLRHHAELAAGSCRRSRRCGTSGPSGRRRS